jgi:soluble lytic murein transglycosylase-like protein
MTPAGMAAVGARIADIQARFAPPSGFGAALSQAVGSNGGDTDPSTDLRPQPTLGATRVEAATTSAASGPASAPAPRPAADGSGAAVGEPAGGVPGWASKLPAAGRPWASMIDQAARSVGIEPELLGAVVQTESGFRPGAVSRAGAIGLAQLMPGTAAALGVDPHDPAENLAGGARYLREQLDRFGAVDLALAAYNAGPHRVAEAGGIPQISETVAYVDTVRDNYMRLR